MLRKGYFSLICDIFDFRSIKAKVYIGEFFQGGFFSLEVVTFFVTLRADLEDYFKCKT